MFMNFEQMEMVQKSVRSLRITWYMIFLFIYNIFIVRINQHGKYMVLFLSLQSPGIELSLRHWLQCA